MPFHSNAMRLYEFKFWDGMVVRGHGINELDALRRLGLSAYNPVSYTVTEIKE